MKRGHLVERRLIVDKPVILEGASTLPRICSELTAASQKVVRQDTSGRFGVLNSFVDETMAKLSCSEIKVWLVLFRDARDGVASTAQSEIARRSDLHRVTVSRTAKRLVTRGLLKLIRRGGLGRGLSEYRVYGKAPED